MSDQLYTSINLSSASLLQGAVAATGAGPLVLGVAPADGSLTSVTVNSDGNDSGITLTVQVDGAPVSAATNGPNAASITIPLTGDGATVTAGDVIDIVLSGVATGNLNATATLG
jgi:hypothetical protein